MYKLTVVKFDVNPNFEAEYKEWESRSRYGPSFPSDSPSRITEVRTLEVTVTDEQFAAVKKAALETM